MNFIRERSLTSRKCKFQEVEWFEYSEEEKEAVRRPRRKRARASPPKIKKMNDQYSRKYFRWLLENNFGKGDYHLTLTFAETVTQERAKRELDNYMARLRRRYKKQGEVLRYLYVTEDERSGARRHFHIVLNGAVPREEIEELWHAGYANCDRLKPDAKDGLFGLARYLMKSQKYCEKFERSWKGSKNLLRPDVVTDDNKVTRRRMRKMQDAARNDEIIQYAERLYKGWNITSADIGCNPVTGRQYARFCMVRRE